MCDRNSDERLLDSLLGEGECEWIEFKKSCFDPDGVGGYASALGNGARPCYKPHGFLVWGVTTGLRGRRGDHRSHMGTYLVGVLVAPVCRRFVGLLQVEAA
jgi:hypothetical protein